MQRCNRIDFVYFDLGNVLLEFDPQVACRNVAGRFDLQDHDVRRAVYESGLQDRYERGDVDSREFADSIRAALGLTEGQLPTGPLLDALSDMFTPIDSMRDVIGEVARGGYRVGLLSNTCPAHWDWIHRRCYRPIEFDFEIEILSFQVGAMKPDEAIYREAERAAGVSADRMVFLDDRPENVAAARERGWNAAQCVGGPRAVEALQSFDILETPR